MKKILLFLNKYAVQFNLICIVFWLYIIYINYKEINIENSFDERKKFFIIPVLFICLSIFNIFMFFKRKKRA